MRPLMPNRAALRVLVGFGLLVAWSTSAFVRVLAAPETWLTVGVVLLAFGFALLYLHYRERMARLRAEWLAVAQFVKLPSYAHKEVWACPHCALPCFSWELVKLHQDPETSPCAAMTAARVKAERDGSTAVLAAPVPGSAAYMPGGEVADTDSFAHDPEARKGEAA